MNDDQIAESGIEFSSVSQEVIEGTTRLMEFAKREGYPSPLYAYSTDGGTVMIEWHFPNDQAIIANVRTSNAAELIYREPGQPSVFRAVPL